MRRASSLYGCCRFSATRKGKCRRIKNLITPADGTIADIETVDEPDFIGGKALQVGIFLSIFDVHLNRSPCRAKVEKITYREGQFLDARNPEAGKVNESNDLWLTRIESPNDKLIVRQISGAIARRIVCRAKEGVELVSGERFGMIKFGSRTDCICRLATGPGVLSKLETK